jgi:hypothetical protein
MILSKIIITAMMRRTWTNPCIVVPVTSPRAHKTSNIKAMVYNIILVGLICRLAHFRASRQQLLVYMSPAGAAIVMLLITLVTPLMSAASLVTRLFSAAFAAMPPTVTAPSVVETEVRKALVE